MSKKNIYRKRILEGIVVSDAMTKTAVVKVQHKRLHPVYRKPVVKYKKFKIHDPQEEAKVGSRVKIIECRPYSKNKRFRLFKVVI